MFKARRIGDIGGLIYHYNSPYSKNDMAGYSSRPVIVVGYVQNKPRNGYVLCIPLSAKPDYADQSGRDMSIDFSLGGGGVSHIIPDIIRVPASELSNLMGFVPQEEMVRIVSMVTEITMGIDSSSHAQEDVTDCTSSIDDSPVICDLSMYELEAYALAHAAMYVVPALRGQELNLGSCLEIVEVELRKDVHRILEPETGLGTSSASRVGSELFKLREVDVIAESSNSNIKTSTLYHLRLMYDRSGVNQFYERLGMDVEFVDKFIINNEFVTEK